MKYRVFLRIQKSHASRDGRVPLRDGAEARALYLLWRLAWNTSALGRGGKRFGRWRRPLAYGSLSARKLRGFAA
jgi:hypothetical protein